MIEEDLIKTVNWLREYVNRMKDREDYEELKSNIDALEKTTRELEDQINALRTGEDEGYF